MTSAGLLSEGEAALRAGAIRRAEARFRQALAADDASLTPELAGRLHAGLGRTLAARGRPAQAATELARAAELARDQAPALEMAVLGAAARLHLTLAWRRPPGAARAAAARQAQAYARRLLDLAEGARQAGYRLQAWAGLGRSQRCLGQSAAAIEALAYASAYAEALGDLDAAAALAAETGEACLQAGRAPEALKAGERGLALLARAGTHDAHSEASLRALLAEAALAQADFVTARGHAAQALTLAVTPHAQAHAHSLLGRGLSGLGQFEAAVREHEAAIALLSASQSLAARRDCGGEWGNLAVCYWQAGRYQPALEALGQAWRAARAERDRLAAAHWQDMLGAVHQAVGDDAAALRAHRAALRGYTALHRAAEAAGAQNNLGTALYRRAVREDDDSRQAADLALAARRFSRARTLAGQAGDAAAAAAAAGNLGLVRLRAGRAAEAAALFEQARVQLEAAGRGLEAGHQWENLGQAFAGPLNDPDRALECYDHAIRTARRYADADGLRLALTRLGDLHASRTGDLGAAEACYQEVVQLAESGGTGRGALAAPAHRAGLLARHLEAYEGLLRLKWRAGNLAGAFDWAERARARAFLEQVGLFAPLPAWDLPEAWLARERELIGRVRELDERLRAAAAAPERAGLAGERRRAFAALARLWDEAPPTAAGRAYAALRRGEPATAVAVQAWLDAQADTALAAYYSLPEAVYIWVLRSGREPRGAAVPMTRAALRQQVEIFAREVPGFPRSQSHPQRWARPLAALVAPVAAPAQGARSLLLIPHGSLNALPLHALPASGGATLGDLCPATYVPGASLLLRPPAAPPAAGRALAFGCTPYAEQAEAFANATRQTARELDAEVYLGEAASRAALRQAAPTARLLYLLCHGRFEPRAPLDSSLALADGPLTAREIMSLVLPGTFVLLIACQAGAVSAGDELIGLSHAFLIAGASAVLAARWDVQADAAAALVQRFYTAWARAGSSPAAALQSAMQAVRALPAFSHPFFWAPFTVIGAPAPQA